MKNLLRIFNLLSLDVALGAVISALAIAKVLDVILPIDVSIALFISVWLIYTLDRLMDVVNLNNIITDRHIFHKRYFTLLSILCVILLITLGTIVFYLPYPVIKMGVLTACLVSAYLLFIHLIKVIRTPKEVLIAILYTLGIFTGPLALYNGKISWIIAVYFVVFILLALANLVVFSLYDQESDRQQQFSSIVLRLGQKTSVWLVRVLLIINTFTLTMLFMMEIQILLNSILLIMNGILFLLMISRKRLTEFHFRFLGDAVFILPAAFVIL